VEVGEVVIGWNLIIYPASCDSSKSKEDRTKATTLEKLFSISNLNLHVQSILVRSISPVQSISFGALIPRIKFLSPDDPGFGLGFGCLLIIYDRHFSSMMELVSYTAVSTKLQLDSQMISSNDNSGRVSS